MSFLKVVLREWRIESETTALKNGLCVNILLECSCFLYFFFKYLII